MNEFEEKMYRLTIETNTNVKGLMRDHKELSTKMDNTIVRVHKLENLGKKTIKEHLISFSKVCGAFLMIGGAYKLVINVAAKLWQ